jgi:hypothetical protein
MNAAVRAKHMELTRRVAAAGASIAPLAAVAALLAATARDAAGAESSAAHLVFIRAPSAAGCPEEAEMRDRVSERLGRDLERTPTTATDSPPTVVSEMHRESDSWKGTIELRDVDGKVRGRRVLTSRAATCNDLAQNMVLTIALVLDADAESRHPPPPAPPGPPPSSPPASALMPEEPPPDVVAAPEPRGPVAHWSVGLGGSASLGIEPAPAPQIDAFVATTTEHLELGIEGHVGLSAETSSSTGAHVDGEVAVASLVPCYRVGVFRGCALAEAGVFRGSAPSTAGGGPSVFYAAVGVRAALVIPLLSAWSLRATADLIAPFTRPTLAVGPEYVWTAPAVGGALGTAVRYEFP